MASPADDDARMRDVTTVTVKGYWVPGATEEPTSLIRAVTVDLNDLETARGVSFDDAAIRLGLDRNELPSRPAVGEGYSSPVEN